MARDWIYPDLHVRDDGTLNSRNIWHHVSVTGKRNIPEVIW